MFIISLTYLKSIEEVEKHLEAHGKFLDEHYALGKFICSGRKNPRTGGVIIAHNTTPDEIEEIVTQDPFYKHQIASYEITEIIPTRCANGFEALFTS